MKWVAFFVESSGIIGAFQQLHTTPCFLLLGRSLSVHGYSGPKYQSDIQLPPEISDISVIPCRDLEPRLLQSCWFLTVLLIASKFQVN